MKRGANANYRDAEAGGATPLSLAARLGSGRLCSVLLGAGANVDARDDVGAAASRPLPTPPVPLPYHCPALTVN